MQSHYSNIFSSGLRVMAQDSSRLPEAGPSTLPKATRKAWGAALSPARLLRRDSSASRATPRKQTTRDVKAARRRTLPAADFARPESWLEKENVTPPIAENDSDDADSCILKPAPLDTASPALSFLITFAPGPSSDDVEDSFLSFSPVSPAAARRRSRTMSLPWVHPYAGALQETEREVEVGQREEADDWRQFHVEWINEVMEE